MGELDKRIVDKIGGFFTTLLGDKRLSKSFRKTLEKYGEATISSIQAHRAPLTAIANSAVNLITGGQWNDLKKKGGVDELFHTYLVLVTSNGTLTLEKSTTALPTLYSGTPTKVKGNESISVPINKVIKVAEFVNKGMKKMAGDYYTYDGFSNNCQDFVIANLSANGLLNAIVKSFIKQDIKRLVDETPSFSKWLAKKVTDTVARASELTEEIIHKKGGLIKPRRFINANIHIKTHRF